MKRVIASALFFASQFAYSEGAVHLTFHIAAGAEDSFRVGTTVVNRNDETAYGGYIVIIPIGEMCKPLAPILRPFGTLLPGETKSLEIAINKRISGYRIASLYAYDKYGFPVAVEDDTRELISKRDVEDKVNCKENEERHQYNMLK
ncbi:membrane-associated Zn-dependent protease 1 [Enterobacter kobei]|uniref:membrane-associated Zn-dependent protease 1 n=1 Tax=Enterobacter kobei TaxID=208224 RepID=UPI0015D50AE0|nr:membrane-associated Zn-dependent protease 1 [Enterobacter kobei]